MPMVQLTAFVMNVFRKENSKPIEPAELLPFPPKPKYLSVTESEEYLDRFFDAYVRREETGKGH